MRLSEISQIGRRLILPGEHQQAVGAQEIVFLADDDVIVALVAIVLVPWLPAAANIRLFLIFLQDSGESQDAEAKKNCVRLLCNLD